MLCSSNGSTDRLFGVWSSGYFFFLFRRLVSYLFYFLVIYKAVVMAFFRVCNYMKPGFGYECKVQKLEECHTNALSLSYNRCTLTIRSKPTHLRNPACPSTPPTISSSSTFVLESL